MQGAIIRETSILIFRKENVNRPRCPESRLARPAAASENDAFVCKTTENAHVDVLYSPRREHL